MIIEAIKFENNAYINTGDKHHYQEFTYISKFILTENNGNQVAYGTSQNGGFAFWVKGLRLDVYYYSSGSYRKYYYDLSIDETYTIVFRRDSSKKISLFINGEKVVDVLYNDNHTNGSTLIIGADPPSPYRDFFKGWYYYAAAWDYAISDEDIESFEILPRVFNKHYNNAKTFVIPSLVDDNTNKVTDLANGKEYTFSNKNKVFERSKPFSIGGNIPNILEEITQPLSEEVFLSEGLNEIEGWNELHKHNGEVICLTDFFGDDVEVLVYEEEPDEINPLQLEFEVNYSPIDEAGDNLELLVPEHLEELQVEGMITQPVYAVSKEMDKSILYNMSDPYIMGNGKAKISVSQDKLNWTNEILVKDISLDWIDALPNKLFIKLTFENCKHCFVGYLSLLDWQMFADEPIVQNDITSVVQNFYSGAYDIPNHKIEASFNDGANWVTVYENKINQIATSAIQTGKLRLRITGTKNQTLYPFSFSWTEK